MIGKYYALLTVSDESGFGDIHNITDICPNGEEWIWKHFGQCVSNSWQWASFIIGFISLVLWFFPSLPQIYQNYKRGNCEEALSPIFLCLWFVGDTLNLTGAVLTKQLPVQIYIGAYYILQDCIILGQYIYYKAKNRWRQRLVQDLGATSGRAAIFNCTLLCFVFAGGALLTNSVSIDGKIYGNEETNVFRSRRLLSRPFFDGTTDEIGYTCGALSAASYLFGRIPQMYKNYKRQSTEGVSVAMYILIIIANITYGASVLLGCDSDDAGVYYTRHLPWLVGSIGCVLFDSVVLVQYYRYHVRHADDSLPIINDAIETDNLHDG